MGKSTLREIKSSFGRWISILMIVALGVGFFSGLKMCETDFTATGDQYVAELNLYDAQLRTTLGLEEKDVQTIADLQGIAAAEGAWSADALFLCNTEEGAQVAKFHTLSDRINKVKLVAGTMPSSADEVVGDSRYFTEADLGSTIQIDKTNDKKTRDLFAYDTYTLTGLIQSPAYLNFERGSTSLGNGSVACFAYLLPSGWNSDVYTEIYVDYTDAQPLFSDAYEEHAANMETQLEQAMDDIGQRRYDAVIDEAREALEDAREKVDDAQAELDDHRAELNAAKADFADGQTRLSDARAAYNDGKKQLATARKESKDGEAALAEGKAELAQARKDYEAGLATWQQQKDEAYAQLDQALSAGMLTQQQYDAAKVQTDQQLAPAWETLEVSRKALTAGEKELAATEKKLRDGQAEIQKNEKKLKDAKREITSGEATLQDSLRQIQDAQKKLDDGQAEIDAARKDLREAEDEVEDIEFPTTYVLGRDTNIGYLCFENDVRIVDGIARVFPVFFFLVAALVCMTTMARMIEEQRTQIGVLKAMGYGHAQILRKYIFYSGSAATIGAIGGFILGVHLFPWVIWTVYGLMYGFAEIIFVPKPTLCLLSLLVALLCSVGTTLYAGNASLREVPAQLIRPKAPKAGKRILLERIPVLWKRLPFLHKVSLRNTFRYKRRFLMMVLGISGCTALLVTGMGIKDSIANVVTAQYDEIYHVDYTVSFQKDMDEATQARFRQETAAVAADSLFLYTGSVDLITDAQTKSINLVVCDPTASISSFIDLHHGDVPLTYPGNGEAIINTNLAENLGLAVGDMLTIRNSDMQEMQVKLTALCDNYVYNYIYLSADTYADNWGVPETNSAFVLGVENEDGEVTDPHGDSTVLMNAHSVSSVSVTADFRARIDNLMQLLNYIVLLVVASAGALAFIVLYNLTNINITERIREIATIKVLGFYAHETASYVFRENILLTAISALVGLPLGTALHAFVMSQVKIDMLSFDVHIEPRSYLLGVLITFVFAFFVNLVMQRKLAKISMAESLKSIE